MKPLNCPTCRAEISVPTPAAGLQDVVCPSCRTLLEIETFPALHRAPQAGSAGELAAGGEAVCYVHADRRAERACDRCGRFMCTLCDLHVGSQHLCAACFEEGRRGRKLAQVERQRIIFPAIAVRLVALSLFMGPFAPVVTIPAIGLAIWGLIKPTSITGSRYAGMASIALVGGLGLTLLWGGFWLTAASRD